jgi:hypothetical protein
MREALAVYLPFKEKVVSHAVVNWPADHARYKAEGKSGAFHYNDSFYKGLGL